MISVPAPSPAGSSENYTVGGLSAGKTYFFAIKTADPETNWSTISNSPSATTGAPDTTPPAAVMNLATSSPTANNITLSWTAPGDNGNAGTASAYSIRYLVGAAITESNWSLATECPGATDP